MTTINGLTMSRGNNELGKRIAHLEELLSQIRNNQTNTKTDKQERVLSQLTEAKTMTMKDIATLLNCSIQTAHVVANELMRRKEAVLVFEPYGKNRRLRLVSNEIAPPELLFNRVGKS
jgi:replication initiation and membrane attachment protein DnaB